jgi:hypothetical protein
MTRTVQKCKSQEKQERTEKLSLEETRETGWLNANQSPGSNHGREKVGY